MLQFYLSMIENQEDRSLFEQIYYKYYKQMFKVAFSIIENKEDAEDAIHDVFFKIAKSRTEVISSIKDPNDLRNYMLTAARTMAITYLNRRNKEKFVFVEDNKKLEDLPDLADGDFTKQVCSASDYDELVDVINSLDSHYREVLNAHFVLELSVRDTAKSLDIKESTARKRINRGKKILLAKLGKGDENKNGNN